MTPIPRSNSSPILSRPIQPICQDNDYTKCACWTKFLTVSFVAVVRFESGSPGTGIHVGLCVVGQSDLD